MAVPPFSHCSLGVGEKIDYPMHRDSLFNDSEYFRIDSELVCFFPPHMGRVRASCETRAHCLTVCASTRRVLL